MNHPDPAAETLPNVQSPSGPSTVHGLDPNPYRFTVRVDGTPATSWVDIVAHDDHKERIVGGWMVPSREEAEHHASLILAALHEAVME